MVLSLIEYVYKLGEHIGSPLQKMFANHVGTDLCVCPHSDIYLAIEPFGWVLFIVPHLFSFVR